jgi:hypothetical protein
LIGDLCGQDVKGETAALIGIKVDYVSGLNGGINTVHTVL